MSQESEEDMELISIIAARLGISKHTIKKWAEKGLLSPAERRANERYVAWYTTERAVREVQANPPRMGRPPKIRG